MTKTKLSLIAALLFPTTVAMAQDSPLWLRYPAISPDGNTIAFAYKGDIYTVSAQGGEAHQLTSNSAYESAPVWSPDGKRIAFASRREGSSDVWIMNAQGGDIKRVTTDSGNEKPILFRDDNTILYLSNGMPSVETCLFPGETQVFEISADGGMASVFSQIAMEDMSINKSGQILYHNRKGYEDPMRKHHTSPIARDLMLMDNGKYRQVSDFKGENRTPRWSADGKSYYYLSEEDGTFNVWQRNIDGSGKTRLTDYKNNPVRFLSVSADNTLCFAWDGEIYTMRNGGQPKKLSVTITSDNAERDLIRQVQNGGATEISVSPKNKEVAFVMHGDVYVTSLDYNTTKRITDTPEQERNIDFAPDGRSIVYASERNGVWQIYQTSIDNKDEKNFTYCTAMKEEQLVNSGQTSQNPAYSPDGKKVAFLENRGELKVLDLKSKKAVTCMEGKYQYSYSDGDIGFEWSPDSRWLLSTYIGTGGWNNPDVALVKADGSKEVHNLTNSGYSNSNAKWVLGGKAMIYTTDKNGYRSHGSWGTEDDVYIMFFDLDAYEKFRRTKEEQEIEDLKPKEEVAQDKKDEKAEKKAEEKAEKKGEEPKEKEIEPLKFDLDDCRDRTIRLTANASFLGDYALDKEGTALYYQSRFEGGYDLWKHDLKENSTTLVCKGIGGGGLTWDKEMSSLYLCGGSIKKYDVGSGSIKNINFEANFNYRPYMERQYLFDHVWRQVKDKFYDPQLHGVDWEGYKAIYAKFLPYINNNQDFADMLSEMLGELNASHTGSGYRAPGASLQTAQLGLFLDPNYQGDGLKVKEVLKRGPFAVRNTGVVPGCIIKKIDGEEIIAGQDYSALLDGKAGKRMRITFENKKGKEQEVIIKPISKSEQNELLYRRWVDRNRQLVDSLSDGKLAYVHVKAMDSQSFRVVFSELLSDKNRNRQAAIIDERHNGGGWLHDDLCTLLSGKQYQSFVPRGQYIGSDPWNKWNKPSCVLICEDDYSNGHGFPFVYKTLGIGKLIGTPVAGTMTAVWWETLMDPSLYFGIPQVGCLDMNGKYGENNTLYPDIEVYNTPEDFINGNDAQLKRAVEEMLK